MFSFLKRESRNPGLIWLDEKAAQRAIQNRLSSGEVVEEEAAHLKKFAQDGYFILPIDLSADDAAQIDRDVDTLWKTRPSNIAFAYDSPPMRMRDAVESEHRRPRYRIHEMHGASETALRLFLHRTLHRYASLILGETAVATQSLYFQFGSQQLLHRDSTVVPTPEFGRLVAAWIALEDISEESGPLVFVPGSQRFPFYEFAPGEYVYDSSRHTAEQVERGVKFYDEQLAKSGLPTKPFLARRGEVLIWHSALMHGGAKPLDEMKTRKSFVVHYSSLQSHKERFGAVRETVDGVDGESIYSTDRILERDGAYGFANALDGKFLYRR